MVMYVLILLGILIGKRLEEVASLVVENKINNKCELSQPFTIIKVCSLDTKFGPIRWQLRQIL